ncbi:MAG: hypothetical protein ACIAQZ_13340 [Sedimentisphaeraceae bacterium JB056]
MTNDALNLEGKLSKSIESEQLGKLTASYAELGLDTILEDGLLKDIPILGTITSLAKIGFNMRDRVYLKKLILFLSQMSDVSQEQREEFVKKSCIGNRYFEETIMLIIEKADRFEKTQLIGKIFKSSIIGKISSKTAFLLSDIVNNTYWADLSEVLFLTLPLSEIAMQRLYSVGLLIECDDTFLEPNPEITLDEIKYEISDYTHLLSLIHFNKHDDINDYYRSI